MSSLPRLSTLINQPVSNILDAAGALVDLSRRVITMVAEVERTLVAVNAATERADALIERIDGIATKAEVTVRAAAETVGAATTAFERARSIAATAGPLLAGYREPLRRLAESADLQEVDALVKLIDRLPRLVNAMDDEVMPLLDRLDQSGPDLNQLLDSVSDLNRMAGRIPKVFRRRREGAPTGPDQRVAARRRRCDASHRSLLFGFRAGGRPLSVERARSGAIGRSALVRPRGRNENDELH